MQHGGHAQPHDDVHWQPRVLQLSALNGAGLAEFWQAVERVPRAADAPAAAWPSAAASRTQAWMWERIEAGSARSAFAQHPARARRRCRALTDDVRAGRVAASVAARRLLDLMN